jgi:hypothetical protein
MPKKVTPDQRSEILQMLTQGHDRETIAATVGVTPGQVSAISAHVSMGTYTLPDPVEQTARAEVVGTEPPGRTSNLLRKLKVLERAPVRETSLAPILLGSDAETDEEIYWNPDPGSGSANPHVLILGESGFGKTYTIASLSAELAQENVVSIIFDYGQGFSPAALPREFVGATNPLELHAGRDGAAISPLQVRLSDPHRLVDHTCHAGWFAGENTVPILARRTSGGAR